MLTKDALYSRFSVNFEQFFWNVIPGRFSLFNGLDALRQLETDGPKNNGKTEM